jgi:hypothetical protein
VRFYEILKVRNLRTCTCNLGENEFLCSFKIKVCAAETMKNYVSRKDLQEY